MNFDVIICLICVHRCHSGHKLVPTGFTTRGCMCNSLNLCGANKHLEMPAHIKNFKEMSKNNIYYPSEEELNHLCTVKFIFIIILVA
jgi:hypothetical protein